MATAPSGRITRSSELALDWAAVFASARGSPDVDSVDVLLGLMFAHPDNSEPLQLLEHFKIPGAAFCDAISSPTRGRAIVATTPLPAAPPHRSSNVRLGADVIQLIDEAAVLAKRSNADRGLARVKDLFGAILTGTSKPGWNALASLLETRGISTPISVLAQDYLEFLSSSDSLSYADFLKKRTPFTPRVLSFPRYDADALTQAGSDRDDPGIPDLVDIAGEIDAFAHLLTAKDLQPPLAIGLFGDWGSGKSFFMRDLQRRIYRITAQARSSGTPQRDLPIYKSVAQIEFNAWHYVEGNLWASLVEYIFRNLRTAPSDTTTELDRRRRELSEKVISTNEAREQVAREIEAIDQRRQLVVDDQARLEDSRSEVLKDAASVGPTTKRILEDVKNDPTVKAELDRVGLSSAFDSVEEFRAAIADARAMVQHGAGAIGRLRSRDGSVVVVTGALTIALVLAVSYFLSTRGVAEITNLIASGAAALTGLTVIIQQGTSWMQGRLQELEKMENRLREAEQAHDAERADIAKHLRAIDEQLATARTRERALEREAEALTASLEGLSPGQLLIQYIDERAGSDDYRKHLGVPWIVRRDLEELSRRLSKMNEAFIKSDDGTDTKAQDLNRIILYIDDLDRCPPRVVVKVLQAVHLLLAFPLFVVVVAVDSRWLANSLERHYQHLLAPRPGSSGDGDPQTSDGQTRASPDDYLEKIFQIPFWVRPLDSPARKRMIEGLIAPSLVFEAPVAGGDASNGGEQPNVELDRATLQRIQRRLFGRDSGDAGLQPSSLQIAGHELEFMQALTPILGESPRAVKRFVNVYRLVKALEEPRDPSFSADRPRANYQIVMFLLAVVTGLPAISARLCSQIKNPTTDAARLGAIAESIKATARTADERSQATALEGWVKDEAIKGGKWSTTAATSLTDWVEGIARFSFGTEISDVRAPAAARPAPARRRKTAAG